MALIRIDPASEQYREFARLYEAARALRPSPVDRWNGELYATVDEGTAWGSFHPSGYFKLSQELVFDKLGPDATPEDQVQALATILHETNHARVEVIAPDEPNAVVSRHSKALDEGLTEWVSIADVGALADRTGYTELPPAEPEYPAAYTATGSLLEYAAGPDGFYDLAERALDAPVVMRWDVIADEIVKNKLGDLVPPDPGHQRAARAELINAMVETPGWMHLDQSRPDAGEVVWRDTNESLDRALQRIRDHYAGSTGQPYPAVIPNEALRRPTRAASVPGPQERIISRGGRAEGRSVPALAATIRPTREPQPAHPSGRQDGRHPGPAGPRTSRRSPTEPGPPGADRGEDDPTRFLSDIAPAAEATHHRPNLGDGARGADRPAVTASRDAPRRGGPGRRTEPPRHLNC